MRALVVLQPFAEQIATGEKKYEYRTWSTPYRGPLVIVAGLSTAHVGSERLRRGAAVCVVELAYICGTCRSFAWQLENPRRVPCINVRGRQKLYRPTDYEVRLLNDAINRSTP